MSGKQLMALFYEDLEIKEEQSDEDVHVFRRDMSHLEKSPTLSPLPSPLDTNQIETKRSREASTSQLFPGGTQRYIHQIILHN